MTHEQQHEQRPVKSVKTVELTETEFDDGPTEFEWHNLGHVVGYVVAHTDLDGLGLTYPGPVHSTHKEAERELADVWALYGSNYAIYELRASASSIPEQPSPALYSTAGADPQEPVTCLLCKRVRTGDDVLDFHPMQVGRGNALGWYSFAGVEICGDCMERGNR